MTASPAAPGTPDEAKPTQARRVRAWFSQLSTAVKTLGGLAGAIAAVLGVLFLLVPSLRPEATPGEGSATFAKPTLEQPVTFGQYLDRVEVPRTGHTDEQLAQAGALAGLQLRIKGYKDERLPLRWYLVDLATNDVVSQQSKRHTFQPDRQDAPVAWPVWVALPPGDGPFKIVFEIYPPNAKPGRTGVVPLHSVETDPFSR
ncbi:MAG TPA: hypothetical protein VEY87_11860 [Gaiellaceae bacterium]|nr:hypothetical protein [Gaiellaceae bacterium]